MAKKAKTIDLNERLTRQARQVETVQVDPAIPTRITVTLDQLVPYDQNPRQTKNPKYDEIKDSIRNRGLDEPPSITRRPGSDHYMIRRGGNTRLQILNELWEETQDDRFYNIDCMFHPWVDDEDALAGHLVENDMRGGMLLIERALGAKQWIQMLEEKAGESISQRKAAEAMTQRGWKMTSGNLSKLLYAADQLLPNLPEALWAGMGVRVVETLRALEKGYQTYWAAIVKLSDTVPSIEWATLWNNTLKEFDDLRFDVPEFRRTLDFKAADALQMSYNTLRSEVDAILAGGQPPTELPVDPWADRPPFADDPWQKTAKSARPQPDTPPSQAVPSAPDPTSHTPPPVHAVQSAPGELERAEPIASAAPSPEQPTYADHAVPAHGAGAQAHELDAQPPLMPLAELQHLAFDAARSFMSALGMEHLVSPPLQVSDSDTGRGQGFGFRLAPIPEPIPRHRRQYYWAMLNTLVAALGQMTDAEAKNNLTARFLPESLETILGAIYPESKPGTELQHSMQDQWALTWARMTPSTIVGMEHPDRPALSALNELERRIAAIRQSVDDDIDSLFI